MEIIVLSAKGLQKTDVIGSCDPYAKLLWGASPAFPGGGILHPGLRDHVAEAIERDCIFDLVDTVNRRTGDYEVPDTIGEIIDPTLRAAIVACDRDGDCASGTPSTDGAEAYVARRRANVSPPDPNGAPVLMLSAAEDVQSPLSRQACTRDYLRAAGVVPTTCAFPGEDHFTVPNASIAHGLAWVEATLAGQPPPPCPDPLPYPECPN